LRENGSIIVANIYKKDQYNISVSKGAYMATISKQALPKVGYLYHYPQADKPKDNFRLDIFISSIPTEQHFDVLRAFVFAKTPTGRIERLKITHPWNYETTSNFCAGVVIVEDRNLKKKEFFTFGGKLEIVEQKLQTICTLESSAPILDISGATPLHKLFVDELEIILAEYKASYLNRREYEKLLCKTDPCKLYQACLKELSKKFEHLHCKDEKCFQMLKYLQSQKRRLRERDISISYAPTLDDIFEKNSAS
jgi:hypothetical protein